MASIPTITLASLEGITLRDIFAAFAMAGAAPAYMQGHEIAESAEGVAEKSYAIADAMLAERFKRC